MTVESDEHQQIIDQLGKLQKDLEYHISQAHGEMMTRAEARVSTDSMKHDIEEIASALLGPRRTAFAGGGRDSEVGALMRIHKMEDRLDKLESVEHIYRFGAKEWATILVALITTIGTLIVTLLQ